MEEILLLREAEIIPNEIVLESALGCEIYAVYTKMLNEITAADYNLQPEWNYYKDGKAWLCKVLYKKKTIFWLSIWDKHMKTGFYFTDKTAPGIMDLEINDTIKQNFTTGKAIGKLLPLTLIINDLEQLDDLKKLINYKKSLK